MKKEKVLILGADGFIGSNLVRGLVRNRKHEIRAFDLFINGKTRNLEDIKNNIEIFSGNFLNRSDLAKALIGVDYVFHFISLTTPGSSMNDPLIDVETNIKGTVVLLDECVKAKIKRVIFSSSGGAIYGNQDKDKFSEEDRTNPISPYAISKLTIEKYLEFYRMHSGLDYLSLRYSNPYGPGQNINGSQGIIPIFINLALNDKPITIFGDGENVRDYIYIDDLIDNTLKIFNKKTKHNIYNLGAGNGKTINQIVSAIEKCLGKKIKISKLPARSVDVRRVVLDIKRIKNEIQYEINTSIRKGIANTASWVKK